MHENFNLFVSLDTMKSVDVAGEDWVFEGIASTADVDLFGDVVYPESFTNSIDFFKSNGKIYFNHSYAQKNADWLKDHGFTKDEILALKMPVGVPLDAKLTDEGLYIKAVLNKEHPLSAHIWKSFIGNKDKRFNDTMGLSIGAKYLGQPRREYNLKTGKYVTYLPELLLYEVSVTPEPVNPHTKTWAYAIKGMMDKADFSPKTEENISYHNITPDEVVFDKERNRLITKSTIVGGSGATFVLESYIDLQEDIKDPMKEKVTLKAAEDALLDEEEKLLEGEELLTEGAEEVEGAIDELVEDAGVEDDPFLAAEAPGDDADDVLSEDEFLEDAEVDGLLDDLIGDDEGAGAEEDDAQLMILDKLDAILDALQNLTSVEDTSAMEDILPGEGQTSDEAPLLKSTQVELSPESAESFGEVLKGFMEGIEDRIVEKVVSKLLTETTVVKSAAKTTTKSVRSQKAAPKVVEPQIALDSATDANPDIVQKSVVEYNGNPTEYTRETQVVLKGLIEEYTGIIGHSTAHSQRRGSVLRRAEEAGVSPAEFYQAVRVYDREQKRRR